MQTRVLLFLLTLLFSSFNLVSFGQIFQPEGLNIPGEWNGWTNPPAPGPFLSSSQSGGLVNLITVGERRWTTTFQSDYSGSRQFLFTSGPSSNAYSNKWGGTTISLNSIQNVFYQSASNNSVSLVNGRFYTINWSDIGYQNTSACVMETSATPVGVSSVVQSPVTNSVYPGNNVLVTASLSASPSTEEKFYVRYTVDGWSTSSVVLMTVSGNSATASIPGQNAGILVSYYVFSSTLTLTSGQSNLTYDLATIRRSSYSNGQNESFTVQNCPNPTFTTVPTSTSCFGESLLYQTQSGMSNYSWSFSGTLGTDFTISSGGNSGSNSASIVWLTQGSKTVTVNYLNALGCTSSNTASNTTSIQAIDFANIQFPQSAAICQGSTAVFYGQLYEPGLTDATAQYGGPIGVVVQFGISSSNTNPATWPVESWQSTQFNFNGSGGNNDEFMITTGSNLSPGTYYYAFRYSLNGCGYQYGGWSGTNGGFWNGSSNVNGVFTINPSSNYFADTDGDGYGAGSATNACSQPAGYVTNNTDCNDASSSVNPGATEVCNGVDDDCDASTDEGVQNTYYADSDGDGYGNSGSTTLACTAPSGYVSNATDCNDASSSVNPGATEICNGIDDDCDATADDGLTFTNYYADSDADGYGAGSATNACSQPAGYVTNNTDCNNSNSSVYPGATEVCNGVDDDCDASTDEGVQNTYYLDADADGYGTTATSATACTAPNGYVANNTDCDDSNSTTYTGAAELCNGADDDCDGSNDEDLIFTNYYVDLDGDGYGAGTATNACTQPAGMVASSTDCDDTDQDVNPGSSEICNAIDDDCDFSTDEGLPVSNYFIDADGDSFGSGSSIGFCSNPGAGYANVGGDCDDSNDAINPDVSELCNNVDDDCDTQIDEGLVYSNYYLDSDGDGFGAGTAINACSNPGASYSTLNTDCNNGNANINPSATETCNGIDDDCDGNADEGSLNTYYVDADGDGFGGSNSVQACSQPSGYISLGGDCYDFGSAINPNATEFCANSIDDNCDGIIDNATLNYYADTDGDGFGGGSPVAIQSCSTPAGYYTTSTDCNNLNSAVYPGAIELCNSIDEDCDGQIDEGTQTLFYADADGDGFGGAATTWACTQPAGYTNSSTDCNDNSANANPGASELCNGADDNCDGQIDEGCPTTIAGEEPNNAIAAPSSYYAYCSNFTGTLAGAFPSNSALSTCITGEDKWYTFIALTTAATISINSSVNNILIELQNFNGALIDVENAVSGVGNEIMNVTGLIPGAQYRVGVRNYNSSSSAGGSFVGCIRHLMAGNCDSGNSVTWPGTLNRCSTFKAKYATTGVQYRYTFTGISGIAAGNVYTRTQSSDYLNLNNLVPSIPSGCSYNVIVTNIYTLSNGAGATEIIEVSQYNPTTINVTADPLTQLRDSDRCAAGPRFRNAIIASLPWVCGVSNWRWRFTEVDNSLQPVGLTFELNRGAASNYLNLGTVSQIQYGKTYAVQTAPIFTYTGSNYIWGPVQYICIIGQTGMILNDSNPSAALNTKDLVVADEIQLNVYPNPSNGQNTYLTVSGIEDDNAKISVFNQVGQLVLQFAMSCESSGTQMELPVNQFVNGLYFIEIYANGKKHHARILIQE